MFCVLPQVWSAELGLTALMAAAHKDKHEAVVLLLAHVADPVREHWRRE
jgi:hypothetical protein